MARAGTLRHRRAAIRHRRSINSESELHEHHKYHHFRRRSASLGCDPAHSLHLARHDTRAHPRSAPLPHAQHAPQNSHSHAKSLPAPASHSQSHHLPSPLPLDLGFLPAASSSQTSLLEAVVGPTARHAPHPAHSAQPVPARAPSAHAHPASRIRAGGGSSGSGAGSTGSSQPGSRDHSGSDGSRSFGTSTEREWDVLSDKSLKLNEGEDPEAVEELQKKVNKR